MKILVLEDEPMILMELTLALEDAGATPLMARTTRDALARIEAERPDAAILDVNLGRGQTCAPVAEKLTDLGIPFLLHSGDLNRSGELIGKFDARIIAKPAPGERVARAAVGLVATGG